MRMKGKDIASDEVRGTIDDFTDGRIAIFDRKGELAFHVRSAHAFKFALRNRTLKDQGLCPAADPAVECAHEHFVFSRHAKRLVPEPADFFCLEPQRSRRVSGRYGLFIHLELQTARPPP